MRTIRRAWRGAGLVVGEAAGEACAAAASDASRLAMVRGHDRDGAEGGARAEREEREASDEEAFAELLELVSASEDESEDRGGVGGKRKRESGGDGSSGGSGGGSSSSGSGGCEASDGSGGSGGGAKRGKRAASSPVVGAVIASGALSLPSLPADVIMHVLKHLSATDLSSVGATCRALRAPAAAKELWAAAAARRGWPADVSGRRAYATADAAELRGLMESFSGASDDVVLAATLSHAAFRQRCPTRAEVAQFDAAAAAAADPHASSAGGSAGANERLASWRRRWGGANVDSTHAHQCSRLCAFTPLGENLWGCSRSGKVHECSTRRSHACALAETGRDGLLVCPASGRSFNTLVGADEEAHGADDEEGCKEEPVGRGLAAAYLSGYWATDEKALMRR